MNSGEQASCLQPFLDQLHRHESLWLDALLSCPHVWYCVHSSHDTVDISAFKSFGRAHFVLLPLLLSSTFCSFLFRFLFFISASICQRQSQLLLVGVTAPHQPWPVYEANCSSAALNVPCGGTASMKLAADASTAPYRSSSIATTA